jgi:hypothetical protein
VRNILQNLQDLARGVAQLCLFLTFLLSPFACSDDSEQNIEANYAKEPVLVKPTRQDIEKISRSISQDSKQESLTIPRYLKKSLSQLKEECDGRDNNSNGLIDEGCFGCCENVPYGDFDCDGRVTKLDCTFPLLFAYSKTTIRNSAVCADLDQDSRIGMGDVLSCLEIIRNTR